MQFFTNSSLGVKEEKKTNKIKALEGFDDARGILLSDVHDDHRGRATGEREKKGTRVGG